VYFTHWHHLKSKMVVSSLSRGELAEVLVAVFLAVRKAWVSCRVSAEHRTTLHLLTCWLSACPTGSSLGLPLFPDCLEPSEKAHGTYLRHDSETPELTSARLAEGRVAAPMAAHPATPPCPRGARWLPCGAAAPGALGSPTPQTSAVSCLDSSTFRARGGLWSCWVPSGTIVLSA